VRLSFFRAHVNEDLLIEEANPAPFREFVRLGPGAEPFQGKSARWNDQVTVRDQDRTDARLDLCGRRYFIPSLANHCAAHGRLPGTRIPLCPETFLIFADPVAKSKRATFV
jgi:hypothetical protein